MPLIVAFLQHKSYIDWSQRRVLFCKWICIVLKLLCMLNGITFTFLQTPRAQNCPLEKLFARPETVGLCISPWMPSIGNRTRRLIKCLACLPLYSRSDTRVSFLPTTFSAPEIGDKTCHELIIVIKERFPVQNGNNERKKKRSIQRSRTATK